MAKKRTRRTRKEVEPPTSSCLLICDDVLISAGRDKHTLHGVIGTIVVLECPARVGPYVAYVRLSNVYSKQEIELIFRKADDDEMVFSFKAKSPASSNPLHTHTLIVKIPQFEIPSAGRYIFTAEHGGVEFAQSRFEVKSIDQQEAP